MKKLITFLLFFASLLLAITFGWDIMDYYVKAGLNIINNNVNREFIMWFGFITSLGCSCYLINETKY